MTTTKTTKVSNTEYTVSVSKKGLENLTSFVTFDEDDKLWFVDFNWDNEYENKEDALRVAKSLVQMAYENKLGL